MTTILIKRVHLVRHLDMPKEVRVTNHCHSFRKKIGWQLEYRSGCCLSRVRLRRAFFPNPVIVIVIGHRWRCSWNFISRYFCVFSLPNDTAFSFRYNYPFVCFISVGVLLFNPYRRRFEMKKKAFSNAEVHNFSTSLCIIFTKLRYFKLKNIYIPGTHYILLKLKSVVLTHPQLADLD